jgi:DNA polymerase-3 subunit epsilon
MTASTKPMSSLSKIMIAFDVETTGKNPDTDQIIEISMCLYEGGREEQYYQMIRPTEVSIAKGAQAVHGISMEDVAEMPTFAEVADEIEEFLGQAEVFVGYNVRFDIRCVEAEFERLGRSIDLGAKLVVDPFRIWQSLEPRSLSDAYRRFVGQELDNAHSAEADVQAAVDVLRGIRRTFNLEEASWEELAKMTNPEKDLWVGPSHQFVWSAEEVVFGFGKYNGRPILEVANRDPGYLQWIQKADFPAHVKSLCKGALSGLTEEDFNSRIIQVFGAPPTAA